MDNTTILVERDGSIATVTLNRPEKLNALNLATWRRLREVMTELDADDGLRCIVHTSEDNRRGTEVTIAARRADRQRRAGALDGHTGSPRSVTQSPFG